MSKTISIRKEGLTRNAKEEIEILVAQLEEQLPSLRKLRGELFGSKDSSSTAYICSQKD